LTKGWWKFEPKEEHTAKLSLREFNALNRPWRRWMQRTLDFRLLTHLGVPIRGRDVLEVGCGSGYAAELLATFCPRSYLGIDFMPEQIELALQRLPGTDFRVLDATDMRAISNASKDTVVIFGALHHIRAWAQAARECARVLRPGGEMYLEEPGRTAILWFDRLFHWEHPIVFSLDELEACVQQAGFRILKKIRFFGIGIYRLKL
jgi:SAM-dependent methyltransferase